MALRSLPLAAVSVSGFKALIADDLRDIARRMVSDGFAQRMVQAFDDAAAVGEGVSRSGIVVLPAGRRLGSPPKPRGTRVRCVRWIRALVVMVHCASELDLATDEPTPALTMFAGAGIAKMVVFVDADLKVHAPADRLHVKEAKTLAGEAAADSTWKTEIARGRGEVHRNIRLMVDCIVSLRIYTGYFCHLIDDAIGYLKDLITMISNLCPDKGLRYIFLLNNSHFVLQHLKPFSNKRWFLWEWERECGLTDDDGYYIDSYFKASWAPVLSCLSSKPSSLSPWSNKFSPLENFVSAFHQTYKSQKLWKVPSPELRGRLWKTVIERVVSGYNKYLEERPVLKELVSRGNSNIPADLEEMLGELFEG
uniref:Exocyst subunit Exo70 family protein n=1 Tax=Leersia perrieri TaxID=77586 RepID=A0A0D9V656_9ORYZ